MSIRVALLLALGVITAMYVVVWAATIRKRGGFAWPTPIQLAIGFVTDFFDTLGIGSFAPTISLFKFFRLVPDERVPGTLNAGHALPTVVEALFFIAIIAVSPLTLVSLIVASVAGAWLGAGVVSKWPRRYVQIGMGGALLAAAALFVMKNLNWLPGGGTALGLSGVSLGIAVVAYICLGALMTLGIGLYAPAMITVSLLGMNPVTAFPIMMGACAFLMPPASLRFIRLDAYSLRAALGLTVGGIPGVIIAARIVKSLPLMYVRWLVVIIVIYAAVTMLRSALKERGQAAAESEYSVGGSSGTVA